MPLPARKRSQRSQACGRDGVQIARPAMSGRIIDRYLLRQTVGPMTAVLTSTMLAFLMERMLRSFHLLAETVNGFGYLMGLLVNLAPHYLALTLPAGFFIALFVVVSRLNEDSEIDAMLASGLSLSRIAGPFVALGVVMMVVSLILYGFIQPYTRYGYRAVLHAAENAGWNGQIRPRAILAPNASFMLTADEVDPTGQHLGRVLIRRVSSSGREDVLTASVAEVHRDRDGLNVTLELHDGQQFSAQPGAAPRMLTFALLTTRLPLAPAARLLRKRGGGEESELTLIELARLGFGAEAPALPRQALLAELYSRLARAIALPLMPLLALPLGLTAKRAGSKAAAAIAGVLLFAFQASLVLGQGLADSGVAFAAHAAGWPIAGFAGVCILIFVTSRKTPGDNPINRFTQLVSEASRSIFLRRALKA